MQTFLTDADVRKSLESLDDKRLGKQRLEARQILTIFERIKNNEHKIGWASHPVVAMWQGYEEFLKFYYNCSLEVWQNRGFVNDKLSNIKVSNCVTPWWLGNELVHSCHRANLLRKANEHFEKTKSKKLLDWYGQFGWTEKPMSGYYWPNLNRTFDDKIKI
jgi:hypothetical protein